MPRRNAGKPGSVYNRMTRDIMRAAIVAAVAAPALAAEALPDADYCSLRGADPARCVIRDSGPLPAVPAPQALVLPNADYCGLRDADPRYCFIQDGLPLGRRAASSASTGSSSSAQAIVPPAFQAIPAGTVVVSPGALAAPASTDRSSGSVQPLPGATTSLPITSSPGTTVLPGVSSFGGAADTPSALVPPSPNALQRQPEAIGSQRPSVTTGLPATGSMPGATTLPGSSSFGGAADMPAALVPPSPSIFQRQPGTSAFPPAAAPRALVLPGASSFGGSADTPAAFAPPRNQPQAGSSAARQRTQ
jgi:hypothetical protein